MTGALLALLASGGGAAPPPSALGVPYPIPASAPFNAPTFCETPTPDGTGSVVHPGVHDFGSGRKWRGWRYWMAITPFWQENSAHENPCILVSNDAFHWHVPAGLTNPVYPSPPGTRFGSDTDLEYAPDTDELVMIYREQLADGSQQGFFARSPDGVTWPHRPTPFGWTRPTGEGQLLSPAIIRKGPGDWYVYVVEKQTMKLQRWTATGPETVTGSPTVCTGSFPANCTPWHLDVLWDGTAWRAILDSGPYYLSKPDGLFVGSSADGIAWTWNPTPVMMPAPGAWDGVELYRTTFAPHENGTHYRVWYSANDANAVSSFRMGYTELPKSLWPTPAA